MKIAIPTNVPDLDGRVENKMGVAAFLLVVETDDMSFEVVDGPSQPSGAGAGVQAVSTVLGMGAEVVLVGYMAPHIAAVFEKQGVEIATNISGSAAEAVNSYMESRSSDGSGEHIKHEVVLLSEKEKWAGALQRGVHQFKTFLPRLIGVILLLGFFRGFISEQVLISVFSGSLLYDSFWGACLGSVLAGNPVNSYVIGNSLLEAGVGLAGAISLMLAWVSVGVIQIPAEADALGWHFAVLRNLAAFAVAIGMSYVFVLMLGGVA